MTIYSQVHSTGPTNYPVRRVTIQQPASVGHRKNIAAKLNVLPAPDVDNMEIHLTHRSDILH